MYLRLKLGIGFLLLGKGFYKFGVLLIEMRGQFLLAGDSHGLLIQSQRILQIADVLLQVLILLREIVDFGLLSVGHEFVNFCSQYIHIIYFISSLGSSSPQPISRIPHPGI